jgi:hypothetical protein
MPHALHARVCQPDALALVCIRVQFVMQVHYLTRLLQAFEPVGVLIQALNLMMKNVVTALVPYVLVAGAASTCFQLFEAPDNWMSPWLRFIGSDDVAALNSPTELLIITWIYALAVDITILNLMIAIGTCALLDVTPRTARPPAPRRTARPPRRARDSQ